VFLFSLLSRAFQVHNNNEAHLSSSEHDNCLLMYYDYYSSDIMKGFSGLYLGWWPTVRNTVTSKQNNMPQNAITTM